MKKVGSFLLFILLVACSDTPTVKNKEVLPNTPETVSKQWQLYLDNNELDKVAALSSTSTKEWLAENKDIFLGDNQAYQTRFLQMTCTEQGEKAMCHCVMKDETGELIEDVFLLVKINGQWLVELEEDTGTPSLEEQLFREMEKELNLLEEEK